MDEGIVGSTARLAWLAGFMLLTIANAGAGLGLYLAASLVFSVHHFDGQGSVVDRPDNFAMLGLVAYLAMMRAFPRSAVRYGFVTLAIAALLGYVLLQLAATGRLDVGVFSRFMRMFGIPLLLVVALRRASLSQKEVQSCVLVIGVVGAYLAIVSLLETAGLYSLILPPWVGDPDFNPALGVGRAGGLLMQPEWNALVVSLGFAVILLRMHQGRISQAPFSGFAAVLCLVAVYFTYTRAAWLGLMLGGFPLLWHASALQTVTLAKRSLLMAGLGAFLCVLVVFPSATARDRLSDAGTMYYRVHVWTAGLRMAEQNPLFGAGFNEFVKQVAYFQQQVEGIPMTRLEADTGSVAHNTLLQVAAELGLVGLVLYLCVVIALFRSALERAGQAWGQDGRIWVIGFSIIYFVNVQFVTAHDLSPNVMYFGIMAVIAGMRLPPQPAVISPPALRKG